MSRISEHDEFLLSQLLDGDLPDEQARVVRARMEREPALREAFETLARVDTLLTRQRAVVHRVDLADLHRSVMAAVRAESAPRIIRFPRWAWAMTPVALAAAAAVALIVTVYRPMGGSPPQPFPTMASKESARPEPVQVAVDEPRRAEPRQIGQASGAPTRLVRVEYNRPRRTQSAGIARVSYRQSQELAAAMRQRDLEYRSRPVSQVFLVERPVIPLSSLLEDPPPL